MSGSVLARTITSLTTIRGALLAAPVVIATGVVLSLAAPDTVHSKRVGTEQSAQAQTASEVAAPAMQLAQTAATKSSDQVANNKAATPTASESASSAFTPAQRAEFGKLVREYLLANPEVIVEVSEELQRRQQEQQNKQRREVLSSSKEQIFRSPVDFVLGDADGDVTIVEYFDYNCGWCKRALNEVVKLSKADPKVRVVMKEFPIFGEHSEFAARAALASKVQGKYWDFHVALMKEGRVTKNNVMTIAERVGLDVEALKAEMNKPKYTEAIRQTQRIAASLGIEGTPGFIIDDQINPGFLPEAQLRAMVADVRQKGCQFC